MRRRPFLKSLAALLGLAPLAARASTPKAVEPRCEVCGARASVRVRDLVEVEPTGVWRKFMPTPTWLLCPAHDRPALMLYLDGRIEARGYHRPIAPA